MLPLVILAIIIAISVALVVSAPIADRKLNQVSTPPPYEVSETAARLHSRLTVVDMHSDFLLWRRDLQERYTRGHVDLPRLREGNVALQVFSVVTKAPWGQNYDRNTGGSDRITLLAVAQAWPMATWSSLRERALHQAKRLTSTARDGVIDMIRTSDDLGRFLERRAAGDTSVAALLAMEGLHPLEGELENVDVFFDAGFRMMAPVHMFDNEVGGSAHGVEQGGLTELGRAVIVRMEELGIIVDLAHASPRLIDDVLTLATRPVVVSHTGISGTCNSPRNLTDDQIRRIASTGGVIGIGFWDRAVCGNEVNDIARAIRYVADLVGTDHVGLGSDFDGTVQTAFDAAGMPLLTQALLDDGFGEEEITKIMGGNVLRVLQQGLP